jgi:ketopantoate reductase
MRSVRIGLAEHHTVSVVGRREHVEAIRSCRLSVTGHTELAQTLIEAVTDPADVGDEPEAVPLTVKATIRPRPSRRWRRWLQVPAVTIF